MNPKLVSVCKLEKNKPPESHRSHDVVCDLPRRVVRLNLDIHVGQSPSSFGHNLKAVGECCDRQICIFRQVRVGECENNGLTMNDGTVDVELWTVEGIKALGA